MGKFDGILLLSDWDGTLAYSDTKNSIATPRVPEENVSAICYFQENGGLFTVCSGRYYTFLKGYYDQIKPNTHVVCYGGALMVAPDTEEVFFRGYAGKEAFDFIDEILSLVDSSLVEYVVTYDDGGLTKYTLNEYSAKRDELAKGAFYKCALRPYTAAGGDEIVRIMRDHPHPLFLFVRSWALGLEIIRHECSKGAALLRLKEHHGARLCVAVGDHENDLDMLAAADISYAVGDGNFAVKQMADRVSVGVREGAVAKVIYDIEKMLDDKEVNI